MLTIKKSNEGDLKNFGEFIMNKNANIQSMLESIESVLQAAHNAVEGMKNGERMQIKQLAQVVGMAVSKEPKHVLAFVNHFAHNTDIAYVTRGKNGGLIKGVKPVKVVKVSKKVQEDTTPATDMQPTV